MKNHALGAGPKGVRISRLNAQNFEDKVIDLWSNSSYIIQAEKIGKQMESEDFDDEICDIIF